VLVYIFEKYKEVSKIGGGTKSFGTENPSISEAVKYYGET